MIKVIEIENIKGIGKKTFNLEIIPNKPSLIVAPNGFGKSSLTTAFKSLNRNRINLHEDDYHKKQESNKPKLSIKFKKSDGTEIDLHADENSNTISTVFDCFVINNQVKAKGVGKQFGGRTNVSADLNIEPIILIDSIPEQVNLGYSYTIAKEAFGTNNKVLPNLDHIFSCSGLFIELLKHENFVKLERTSNQNVKQDIVLFKDRIGKENGNHSKSDLINWIRIQELSFLKNIDYLSSIANVLMGFDLGFKIDVEVESYLAVLQLIELFHQNKQTFKKFCKRKEYDFDKDGFTRLFKDFNTTWLEIKPKEKGTSLLLEFPKAHLISNGQRDVLCFMALLEKAKKKLAKENSILIIDEVFDYLDEANLIAVQYYTTDFIESFKAEHKNIYPLILTHLDPLYFKGYVFGRKHKIKTYYLDKVDSEVLPAFIKVLKERNNLSSILKDDIEKYLLHFHTYQINRRVDFENCGLRPTWGESNNFDQYVLGQAQKYCSDEIVFDPLAVCCAVRKRIEMNIYNQILDPIHQNTFLNVMASGTNEKLEFAESIGVQVNESYYFLGIVYNEALHWKDDRDNNSNISPAMGKLKNLTIKKLIKGVFK